MTWLSSAACRNHDPDLWFPNPGDNRTARQARTICNTQCPVRSACLDYALANGEKYGIWGGMSEPERRKIRRARRRPLFTGNTG